MALTEANAETILLMRRRLDLKRKLLQTAKQNGLAFYKPSPKQDAFHQAGTQYKRRMVRAGNRFGKSTCGIAEDISWLIGERPFYSEGHPARRGGIPQHPVKLLTITTDWDKVDEIFTSQRGEGGKVWKYMPAGMLVEKNPVRRNHSGAIDTISLRNGSIWRFDTVKSYMANPMGSESSDWDAIHVDEPLPEQMFKAAARGLIDRGGSAWFTLTPLTEFWINDYFFPQELRGETRDNVWATNASIYDNPVLSVEAIKEFEALLEDDEKQCRLLGLPLHLSGLVYKQFNWDKHVLKNVPKGWASFDQPPLDWPVYYNIDPHPQTPHAVLFCTVSPFGQRFYFADIFRHCSVAELARLIREKVGPRQVVEARIDPLAFINDPITETNMAEEFWRSGCFVEKATKALSQGILRVQGELGKQICPVVFCPTAARTLWEIQRYCWDKKDNKPIDKDDHMMENLYRMELQEPRWVEVTPQSNPVEELVIAGTNLQMEAVDDNW